MSLKTVFDAWARLNKSKDWQGLLADAGLAIDVKTADEFLKVVTTPVKVDRTVSGFEDFDPDGMRGIEGGDPGRSLLYHAFASPKVVSYRGIDLNLFPTLEEIIALENLIFQEAKASWGSLYKKASKLSDSDKPEIGVVVFSYDYQPAERTVHRKNADLCFARTGVARVGTHKEHFSQRDRGWFTFNENDDPSTIRVIPARYGAFLAVRLNGDEHSFGPKYFHKSKSKDPGDKKRHFWVPLHKLFSGKGCLEDCANLSIGFGVQHINEKIRRIHLELHRRGMKAHTGSMLNDYPFSFSADIADLTVYGDSAIVIPRDQSLVKPAEYKGKPLTLYIPRDPSLFLTTFRIRPNDAKHVTCSKYVNCRTLMTDTGQIDLNTRSDMFAVLHQGDFEALHYVDFTGDGYVNAVITGCDVLAQLPSVPAYSIVAQPDFLPFVEQSDLYNWWREIFPDDLRNYVWGNNDDDDENDDPAPLSKSRLRANFATHPQAFNKSDDTISATVAMPRARKGKDHQVNPEFDQPIPNSYLPDDASGDFAPGWDVAIGITDQVLHLTAYGMSSPFPEDARLCSAFGASWPAAAPDITNWFPSDGYYAVAPLGNQAAGWDQTILPFQPFLSGTIADYPNPGYSDWVQAALRGKLHLANLKGITLKAYTSRISSMARFYKAIKAATRDKMASYSVIYFSKRNKDDVSMVHAFHRAKATKFDLSKAFEMHYLIETDRLPGPYDFHRLILKTSQTVKAYISPNSILVNTQDDEWKEQS